jgi:hypothetical protein
MSLATNRRLPTKGSIGIRLQVASEGNAPNAQRAARGKEISLRRIAFDSIAACLAVVAFSNIPAAAQESDMRRVVAETLDLAASPASNIQLKIWADRLPEIIDDRRELLKTVPQLKLPLATEVFTASFKGGDRTLVVSAVHYRCASTEALPNELDCPARVAEVAGGTVRILKEIPNFPFVSVRGAAGYDASSNAQTKFMTLLSYDSKARQLVLKFVSDGEASPSEIIRLK